MKIVMTGRTMRSRTAMLLMAGVTVLGGCSGGGGGSSAPKLSSPPPSSTGTSPSTKNGNAVFVSIPNAKLTSATNPFNGIVKGSVQTSETGTMSFNGAQWELVSLAQVDRSSVVNEANKTGGTVYRRKHAGTVSITGGPSLANGTHQFTNPDNETDYVVTDGCHPKSSGCAIYFSSLDPDDLQDGSVSQNGKEVTSNTFDPSKPLDADAKIYVDYTGAVVPKSSPFASAQYATVGQFTREAGTLVLVDQGGSYTADTANSSLSRVSGFSYGGSATPSADMDALRNQSVKATYAGAFGGEVYSEENGTVIAAPVTGLMNLSADFGKGTVTGSTTSTGLIYNTVNTGGSIVGLGYGIAIDADITGNSFAGTSHFIDANDDKSGTGISKGGFFGPNAAEIAGVAQVSGTAPGTNPTVTTTVQGALVGSRQ